MWAGLSLCWRRARIMDESARHEGNGRRVGRHALHTCIPIGTERGVVRFAERGARGVRPFGARSPELWRFSLAASRSC